MSKQIYVYADWMSQKEPIFIGVLSSDILRGKEVFSFSYDQQWLGFTATHER